MRHKKSKGVTLVEMLAVVGIMLVLIALLITVGTLWRARTLQELAIAEIKGMQAGLQRYYRDHHRYPNFRGDASSAPLVAALMRGHYFNFPNSRLTGSTPASLEDIEQQEAAVMNGLITASWDRILGRNAFEGLRGEMQGVELTDDNRRKVSELLRYLLMQRYGGERENITGYKNDPNFSGWRLNDDGTLRDDSLLGDEDAAAGYLLFIMRKFFFDPPAGVSLEEMANWTPEDWNDLIEQEMGADFRLDAAGAARTASFAADPNNPTADELAAWMEHEDWLQRWRDYFHTDGIFADPNADGYGRAAIESAFGDHTDWLAAYSDFGNAPDRGGVHVDTIYKGGYRRLEDLRELGNMIAKLSGDVDGGVYSGQDLADAAAARDRLQDIYDHILGQLQNGAPTDFADRDNLATQDIADRNDAFSLWYQTAFVDLGKRAPAGAEAYLDSNWDDLTAEEQSALAALRQAAVDGIFTGNTKVASHVGGQMTQIQQQVNRLEILESGLTDPGDIARVIELIELGNSLTDSIARTDSDLGLVNTQMAALEAALGLDARAAAALAINYYEPTEADAIFQAAAEELDIATKDGYLPYSDAERDQDTPAQQAAEDLINGIIGWEHDTDDLGGLTAAEQVVVLDERLDSLKALSDDLVHSITQAILANQTMLDVTLRENLAYHVQHNPAYTSTYIDNWLATAGDIDWEALESLGADSEAYRINHTMASLDMSRSVSSTIGELGSAEVDMREKDLALQTFLEGYADEVNRVYHTITYELFGDPTGVSNEARERLDTFAYGCAVYVIEQVYRGQNPAIRSLFDELEYISKEIARTHNLYEQAGGTQALEEYLPLDGGETTYYEMVRDGYFGNEDGHGYYDGYGGGSYTDDRFATGTDSGYLRNEDGSLDDRLAYLNVGGGNDGGYDMSRIVSAGGPYVGVVGEPVRLAGTYRGDSPAASMTWSYDDGSPDGVGLTSSHVYTQPGTYMVTYEVTNAAGDTYTNRAEVAIYPSDYAMQVAEAGGPYTTRAGDPLTLTGTYAGTGYEGADYRWAVDLNGDGDLNDPGEQNYATGPRPTISFAAPGDYLVELQVRPEGETGYTVSDRATVEVYEQSPQELAQQLQDLYDQYNQLEEQLGDYTKQLNNTNNSYRDIVGESRPSSYDDVSAASGQEFLDPWGNPYLYQDPAGTEYEDEGVYYLIISRGADGQLFVESGELDEDPGTSGVPDDIVNGLPIAEKLKRAMIND